MLIGQLWIMAMQITISIYFWGGPLMDQVKFWIVLGLGFNMGPRKHCIWVLQWSSFAPVALLDFSTHMCGSRTCGFYMILPRKVGLKLKEREHRCPKNGHHGGFALKKNTQPPQTFGTQPAGAPYCHGLGVFLSREITTYPSENNPFCGPPFGGSSLNHFAFRWCGGLRRFPVFRAGSVSSMAWWKAWTRHCRTWFIDLRPTFLDRSSWNFWFSRLTWQILVLEVLPFVVFSYSFLWYINIDAPTFFSILI